MKKLKFWRDKIREKLKSYNKLQVFRRKRGKVEKGEILFSFPRWSIEYKEISKSLKRSNENHERKQWDAKIMKFKYMQMKWVLGIVKNNCYVNGGKIRGDWRMKKENDFVPIQYTVE